MTGADVAFLAAMAVVVVAVCIWLALSFAVMFRVSDAIGKDGVARFSLSWGLYLGGMLVAVGVGCGGGLFVVNEIWGWLYGR